MEHLAHCFSYQNVMTRFSWNNICPKKFPKHSMGFWSDVYKLLDRPKYLRVQVIFTSWDDIQKCAMLSSQSAQQGSAST